MIVRLFDFFMLAYKLAKWCFTARRGAVFFIYTDRRKISDFYRKPTSAEEVRQGVWASTTDAANRGVIGIREGAD